MSCQCVLWQQVVLLLLSVGLRALTEERLFGLRGIPPSLTSCLLEAIRPSAQLQSPSSLLLSPDRNLPPAHSESDFLSAGSSLFWLVLLSDMQAVVVFFLFLEENTVLAICPLSAGYRDQNVCVGLLLT